MLKRFTINTLLVGRPSLREAQKRLRSLGIRRRDIDYISHLDGKENAVQIARSHKGHICLSYGFLLGAGTGLIISLLNESILIPSLAPVDIESIAQALWIYMSAGAFVGGILGFLAGRGLVQYVLRYGKGEPHPNLHYLLMVNVELEQRDQVMKALEPIADTIDFTDNNREVELGLQSTGV